MNRYIILYHTNINNFTLVPAGRALNMRQYIWKHK